LVPEYSEYLIQNALLFLFPLMLYVSLRMILPRYLDKEAAGVFILIPLPMFIIPSLVLIFGPLFRGPSELSAPAFPFWIIPAIALTAIAVDLFRIARSWRS
jgi:hypothetical protein